MRLVSSFLLAASFVSAVSAQSTDVAGPVQADDQAPLAFGVFPYLTPLRLEAIYAPISKALSEGVGRPVRFRTASRFELFFAKLKAEQFDVAFIQPIWYVHAADEFGYLPLARIKEPLTALIVVLDDGPIRSAEDLRGKTVATPPSYGPVTRLVKRVLNGRGLVPGRDLELKGFKSVESCYQHLDASKDLADLSLI